MLLALFQQDRAVVAFLAASFRSMKWLNKCQKKYHPPICYFTESIIYEHLAFCSVPLIRAKVYGNMIDYITLKRQSAETATLL